MNALVPVAFALLLAAPSTPTPRAAVALASIAPCEDAYLGVYLETAKDGGARVSRVVAGSPAEGAGLRVDDRVVAVSGDAIDGADALVEAVRARAAGDEVEIRVVRGGEELTLDVELGAAPAQTPAVGGAFGLRTVPAVEVRPFETQPVTPFWTPLTLNPAQAAPDAAHAADLEQRLEELRRDADRRFAELERRLDEMRASAGDAEQLDRLSQELERDHAERQRRFEELSGSIRAAIEHRRAQAQHAAEARRADVQRQADERRGRAREEAARVRVEARAERGERGERGRAAAGGGGAEEIDPGALAGELEGLRDEVRGLRDEIRALRDLLQVR